MCAFAALDSAVPDYHIFAGRHPFLAYPRVMGHELAVRGRKRPKRLSFPCWSGGGDQSLSRLRNSALPAAAAKPNACASIRRFGVSISTAACAKYSPVPERAVIDASGLIARPGGDARISGDRRSRGGARPVALAATKCSWSGAGPIGIATAIFAGLDGASVTLVDTRQPRLDAAHAHAPAWIGPSSAGPHTRGDTGPTDWPARCSTPCSTPPAPLSAMTQSLAFISNGGTLVLGQGWRRAISSSPIPSYTNARRRCSPAAMPWQSDFKRVIAAMRAGRFRPRRSRPIAFGAEDLPERIPMLIAEADNVLKAIAHF